MQTQRIFSAWSFLGLMTAATGMGCGDTTAGAHADAPVLLPSDASSIELGSADVPIGPASCDDSNSCTSDSWDTTTQQCLHLPLADATPCQGKPCSTNSTCKAGTCLDGPYKTCTVLDQCHVAGMCSPKTGECTNPPETNGTRCDDGLKCTYADVCTDGVCGGTLLSCRNGVTCDTDVGYCPGSFPTPLVDLVIENVVPPSGGNAFARGTGGEIYISGSIYGQVDLGAGTLKPYAVGVESADVFLARLDPASLHATWSTSLPGPKKQSVAALAVSSGTSGSRLATIGNLSGAITVVGEEIDALYNGDQYVFGADAKDGEGLWAWRLNLYNPATRSNDVRPVGLSAIAGDTQNGSFSVCGTVACGGIASTDGGVPGNPASVLGVSSTCQGGLDAVVANVDGDTGKPLWAQEIGGTNNEDCGALAVDSQSNTIVAGTYRFASEIRIGNFDPLPIVGTVGAAWLYMAKLDSNGKAVWAQSFGRNSQSVVPTAMIALGTDFILAGTTTSNSLDTQAQKGSDLGSTTFVARFDGDGNSKWIQGLGAGGGLQVTSISSVSDRILVAGNYLNGCTLGSAVLAAPGASADSGAFVAQLDIGTGVLVTAKGYGDSIHTNKAAGLVGRLDGAGSEMDSSLVLLSFHGAVDLGSPLGALSGSGTPPPLALVKLAP